VGGFYIRKRNTRNRSRNIARIFERKLTGGIMAKTVEVEITFTDRTSGPGTSAGKSVVTAGSLATGIGRGVREIMKKMDRKQRFDAAKHGINVSAKLTDEAEEKDATAASA
jgi:hypothetical protein